MFALSGYAALILALEGSTIEYKQGHAREQALLDTCRTGK